MPEEVELHCLDVYDPTTDEIACWFMDTDDKEESFFVRHAYFTGADEPHEELQRALKAEIDEDA
jgi:adenine-specific DNA-methyltransferase